MRPGLDYYLEDGFFVFTSQFLSERGFCCGNKCRHCPYEFDKDAARVVSLVPSMTETLIECGIKVVGRSRFCIHPSSAIQDITAVGGTKDLNIEALSELKPDFVLLDREENTKEMAKELSQLTAVQLISQVCDLGSFITSLIEINRSLKSSKINQLIQRAKNLEAFQRRRASLTRELPGLIEWIKTPEEFSKIDRLVYVIWRNPWMRVTSDTFIGSQLKSVGLAHYLDRDEPCLNKYPEFDLSNYDPDRTLFLFSSEPYPFNKKKDELKALKVFSAIVDGEAFSWFGIRGIRFLEKLLLGA